MSKTLRLKELVKAIRATRCRSEEKSLVSKELALLRNSIKSMGATSYSSRNCLKCLYLLMLGYDNGSFIQVPVLNIIASHRFLEKRVGYICLSGLLDLETSNLTMLVTNTLYKDIQSSNMYYSGLAMAAAADLNAAEVSRTVAGSIIKGISDPNVYISRKACLSMNRLLSSNDDCLLDVIKEVVSVVINCNTSLFLTLCPLLGTCLDVAARSNTGDSSSSWAIMQTILEEIIPPFLDKMNHLIPQMRTDVKHNQYTDYVDVHYHLINATRVLHKLLSYEAKLTPIWDDELHVLISDWLKGNRDEIISLFIKILGESEHSTISSQALCLDVMSALGVMVCSSLPRKGERKIVDTHDRASHESISIKSSKFNLLEDSDSDAVFTSMAPELSKVDEERYNEERGGDQSAYISKIETVRGVLASTIPQFMSSTDRNVQYSTLGTLQKLVSIGAVAAEDYSKEIFNIMDLEADLETTDVIQSKDSLSNIDDELHTKGKATEGSTIDDIYLRRIRLLLEEILKHDIEGVYAEQCKNKLKRLSLIDNDIIRTFAYELCHGVINYAICGINTNTEYKIRLIIELFNHLPGASITQDQSRCIADLFIDLRKQNDEAFKEIIGEITLSIELRMKEPIEHPQGMYQISLPLLGMLLGILPSCATCVGAGNGCETSSERLSKLYKRLAEHALWRINFGTVAHSRGLCNNPPSMMNLERSEIDSHETYQAEYLLYMLISSLYGVTEMIDTNEIFQILLHDINLIEKVTIYSYLREIAVISGIDLTVLPNESSMISNAAPVPAPVAIDLLESPLAKDDIIDHKEDIMNKMDVMLDLMDIQGAPVVPSKLPPVDLFDQELPLPSDIASVNMTANGALSTEVMKIRDENIGGDMEGVGCVEKDIYNTNNDDTNRHAFKRGSNDLLCDMEVRAKQISADADASKIKLDLLDLDMNANIKEKKESDDLHRGYGGIVTGDLL